MQSGSLIETVAGDIGMAELLKDLMKSWNPLDTKQQRLKAIDTAQTAVTKLTQPNFGFFLEKSLLSDEISSALEKADVGTLGVKLQQPEISFFEQGIDVRAGFELPIGPAKVSGTLDGTAAVEIMPSELHILPAFSTLRVNAVEVGGQPANAALVATINAGLSGTIAALNAAVQSKVKPIPLNLTPLGPFDVAAQLRTIQGVAQASGQPLNLRLGIVNVVPLIDERGIALIGELGVNPSEVPVSVSEPSDTSSAPSDIDDTSLAKNFQSFAGQFKTASEKYFPQTQLTTSWIAIQKPFIASVIAMATSDERVNVRYNLANLATSFKSGPIQPFNYESISCPLNEDTRACSVNQCSLSHDTRDCSQPHDDRNCSACLLRAPRVCVFGKCTGGNCVQSGNDPTCEFAKAAQNKVYDANRAGCETAKAAQNTANQSQFALCQADSARLKGQCETEKAAQNAAYVSEKALCESGKEAVKRLQAIGPIGEVHGDVQGSGTFELSLASLSTGQNLESLSASIGVQGNAHLTGNVGFQPYNAGIALCTFPWQEPFEEDATIPHQDISESVSIEMSNAGDHVAIRFTLQESQVNFSLKPTPVEALFAAHPQVALNCAPVAATAGVASAIQPLTGDMLGGATSGKFQQNIPALSFTANVPTLDLPIADKVLHLTPSLIGENVLFSIH
jgi:hypothetical protein